MKLERDLTLAEAYARRDALELLLGTDRFLFEVMFYPDTNGHGIMVRDLHEFPLDPFEAETVH